MVREPSMGQYTSRFRSWYKNTVPFWLTMKTTAKWGQTHKRHWYWLRLWRGWSKFTAVKLHANPRCLATGSKYFIRLLRQNGSEQEAKLHHCYVCVCATVPLNFISHLAFIKRGVYSIYNSRLIIFKQKASTLAEISFTVSLAERLAPPPPLLWSVFIMP